MGLPGSFDVGAFVDPGLPEFLLRYLHFRSTHLIHEISKSQLNLKMKMLERRPSSDVLSLPSLASFCSF